MLGKLKQTEELGRHTLSKTLILSPNIEKIQKNVRIWSFMYVEGNNVRFADSYSSHKLI